RICAASAWKLKTSCSACTVIRCLLLIPVEWLAFPVEWLAGPGAGELAVRQLRNAGTRGVSVTRAPARSPCPDSGSKTSLPTRTFDCGISSLEPFLMAATVLAARHPNGGVTRTCIPGQRQQSGRAPGYDGWSPPARRLLSERG